MRASLKFVLLVTVLVVSLLSSASAGAANSPMTLVLGAPNGVPMYPSNASVVVYLNAGTRAGVVPSGSVDVRLGGGVGQSVPAGSLYGSGATVTLPAAAVGSHVVSATYAGDSQYGPSSATLSITVYPSSTPQEPQQPQEPNPPVDMTADGYRVITRNGQAFDFGTESVGGLNGSPLPSPVVGATPTITNRGWWAVTRQGTVIATGDAAHRGDADEIALNKPIVGMAATPGGDGYWLVASDGGIFSYGNARFYGSTGSLVLNKPIVGMTSTPSGNGYWLVASDGGIFSYGDANFFGSTGSMVLNKPVVGMASTNSGNGYWLVASDGGIFSFGDAQFFGSAGSLSLNKPIIGMQATASGNGYWFVASDAGVFAYGDAPFRGTVSGRDDIAAFVS